MAANTKSQAGFKSNRLETSVKSRARIVLVSISPYLVHMPSNLNELKIGLGFTINNFKFSPA